MKYSTGGGGVDSLCVHKGLCVHKSTYEGILTVYVYTNVYVWGEILHLTPFTNVYVYTNKMYIEVLKLVLLLWNGGIIVAYFAKTQRECPLFGQHLEKNGGNCLNDILCTHKRF